MLSDGTSTYLYGQDRISREQAGQVSYFLPDALGSVRTVFEGEEVLLAQDYTPYGEVLASAGSGASSYGYAGEWTDASDMQYLRARFYDPYLNQFIQADSIVPDPSIPANWNKYAYVQNNPVNFSDPSGKSPLSDAEMKA